jgi:hypothetical protein
VSDTWVQEDTGELICEFVDSNGSHGKVRYGLLTKTLDFSSAGPAALIPDTAALSDALLSKAVLIKRAVNTTPALNGTGPYDLVKDKAIFVFNGKDGERVRLAIPTVVETCLEANQLYINQANSDVIALVAAMTASAVTAEGKPLVDLALAYRTRSERVKNQL